jgi:hypothetical protein
MPQARRPITREEAATYRRHQRRGARAGSAGMRDEPRAEACVACPSPPPRRRRRRPWAAAAVAAAAAAAAAPMVDAAASGRGGSPPHPLPPPPIAERMARSMSGDASLRRRRRRRRPPPSTPSRRSRRRPPARARGGASLRAHPHPTHGGTTATRQTAHTIHARTGHHKGLFIWCRRQQLWRRRLGWTEHDTPYTVGEPSCGRCHRRGLLICLLIYTHARTRTARRGLVPPGACLLELRLPLRLPARLPRRRLRRLLAPDLLPLRAEPRPAVSILNIS